MPKSIIPFAAVTGAFLLFSLAGCSDGGNDRGVIENASSAKTPEPDTLKIKPESLVVFPQSGFACLTRESLQKIMEHGIRGEETKMKSMIINPKTGRGQCIMLSTTQRYKVISSEYNSESTGIGLLEIVGEGNMSSDGAWAFSIGAEMAKK